ncbi:MAG: L-aspartate oxidase [Planctomycetota bacterium]
MFGQRGGRLTIDARFDERRYLIPFRSGLLPQIFTDTLVIGAGVAGLRAAIEASGAGQSGGGDVIVLAKGGRDQSATAWAQGGVAGVLDEIEGGEAGDTPESHLEDTLTAGAGLCDEPTARLLVEDGGARIRELIEWGMPFDVGPGGLPAVGREGGHSARRIFHAGGDATGAALQRTLWAKLNGCSGVRVFDECFALDLVTPGGAPGSPVLGAITHHPKHGLQMIWAKTTILASGGAGQIYRETTNPAAATGDGLAMAYRAGATLADLAFVQFHPTVLYVPGAARSLISEAVGGEGATLLDDGGRRFMQDVHELAELAPRDVVSRAIVHRIAAQGGKHVWLDCRDVKGFAKRFPSIAGVLERFGIDPAVDLAPVHPAAHYSIGGVRTDLETRTNVPNLLAVGEVASNGLHGANRLASNSLLEGLVFGRIAGALAGTEARRGNGGGSSSGPTKVVSDIPLSGHGELDLDDVRSSVRSAMWRNAGLLRTGEKLADLAEMLDFWAKYTLDKIFDEPEGWEAQNLLLVGALMARSAGWRTESRGAHTREDFPERESPAVHDLWRRGAATVEVEEVAPGSRSEVGA